MSKQGAQPQEDQASGAAAAAAASVQVQPDLHEQIPYKDSRQKARSRTKHELLNDEHKERENVAKEVIQAIKTKLAGKEATAANVLDIINTWRDQIRLDQKLAAGLIPPRQPKVAAKDASAAAASSAENKISSPLLLAYLNHAASVPSSIAYEVNFFGISVFSVGERCNPSQQEAEQAGKVANLAWAAAETERMKRLQEIDKVLAENVRNWQRDNPALLTDAQIKERDRLRDFTPLKEEDKQTRDAAIARVNGFPPIVDHTRQAAIQKATEIRLKKAKQKLARQMAEHPEEERELMQLRYGILPISASRQTGLFAKMVGKVGIGCWQNDFELDPARDFEGYPEKERPRRAVLDPDQKALTWKERRELAKQAGTAAMPKRVYAQGKVKEDQALTTQYKARLERDKAKFSAQEHKDLMELDSKPAVDELANILKRVLKIQ